MKYLVKSLAKEYLESYDYIPQKDPYKELIARGFDIIDEIEKDDIPRGANPCR